MNHGWAASLAGLLDRAWSGLKDGTRGADAPARLVVLATRARDGGAAARTVALRRADRGSARLEIYTDLATGKVAELRAEPRATVLAYLPDDLLQIRARVRVTVQHGPDLDALWETVPPASRRNYGGAPPPGAPLARSEEYRETVERARFGRLVGAIDQFDLVHLGEDLHRRAIYDAGDGFAGRWIGP